MGGYWLQVNVFIQKQSFNHHILQILFIVFGFSALLTERLIPSACRAQGINGCFYLNVVFIFLPCENNWASSFAASSSAFLDSERIFGRCLLVIYLWQSRPTSTITDLFQIANLMNTMTFWQLMILKKCPEFNFLICLVCLRLLFQYWDIQLFDSDKTSLLTSFCCIALCNAFTAQSMCSIKEFHCNTVTLNCFY